jgi:hypothetical protein
MSKPGSSSSFNSSHSFLFFESPSIEPAVLIVILVPFVKFFSHTTVFSLYLIEFWQKLKITVPCSKSFS